MDNSIDVVGLICPNQDTAKAIIAFLGAHFGLSVVSATLKKLGISKGMIVAVIRFLAVDVQPLPKTVLANAEEVKETGKVSIVSPPAT